jgi:hypothetical protein
MILGGADAPAIAEDDDIPPMPASLRSPGMAAPVQRIEPQRAPLPQPKTEERRGWGSFLGRAKKKDEPRIEPVQQRPAPRATAQPIARAQPEPAAAEAPPRPQTLADDLFPDHKRDDQFEIPAFLRRQSN